MEKGREHLANRFNGLPPGGGSTGYQPVSSGNLPDGMAVTLENQPAFQAFERVPHSVGQVAQRDGLVARSTQTGGEAVEMARPSASDATTGLKPRC